MAICTFEELGLHEVNNCIYPKGGISAIAVLKTGHGITDWTDDVEWDAAITAGTVRIIANTKSDLPAASAIEGENPLACGSETIVDSFDYTINLKDFNVSTIDKSLPVPVANNANDAFWNDANRSQFVGIVLFMCEQSEIRVVLEKVSFNASLIIPMTNKEKQYYQVVAKWNQSVNNDMPVLYDAPAGIFE